jgi:hypothetical protein
MKDTKIITAHIEKESIKAYYLSNIFYFDYDGACVTYFENTWLAKKNISSITEHLVGDKNTNDEMISRGVLEPAPVRLEIPKWVYNKLIIRDFIHGTNRS